MYSYAVICTTSCQSCMMGFMSSWAVDSYRAASIHDCHAVGPRTLLPARNSHSQSLAKAGALHIRQTEHSQSDTRACIVFKFYVDSGTYFTDGRTAGDRRTAGPQFLETLICVSRPRPLFTMATLELIKESIVAQKDRTGSSTIAITRWIEANKKVRPLIVEI